MVEEKLEAWREKNPLRMHRIKKDMTLADAATWLSVAVNTINRWEDGTSVPGLGNMVSLTSLVRSDIQAAWNKWIRDKPKPDHSKV